MPMMKNVVGLDLGSHSIKVVELRQTLRGLEPVQLRLHPTPDEAADLPETLHRFFRVHHIPSEHVVVALPGHRISSRRLDFPFRDRRRLASAVPFEVEGEVPFPIEDVLVDWEIVGGDRTQATVTAAVVQRKHVAELIGELREANCDPRVVEAEGFVLGNLASTFDLAGTRLMADLGHRKTTLSLLMDGTIVAMRTLPVGGAAITQALARDRGWNLQDAEQYKCQEGIFQLGFNSSSPGALAVLDRIVREMVRTLESLEPVIGGPPASKLSGVTLVGGTAKLHRVEEYLAQRTGLEVSRIALPPSEEGAALVAGGDPVLFAPAIALALRGTTRATTRMNFRRQEFAYRTDLRQFFGKDLRPTAALAAGVLVLLTTSVVTGITLDSRRASQLESQVAQIYADAFPGQAPPPDPIAAMRAAGQQARERADFLGVYGGNRSALDLLAELSRRVPADLEVKFEEVSIDRRVIRIKVYSTSFEAADRLEAQLASGEPFEQAKIDGEIKGTRRGEGKTFNLTIPLAIPGEPS